MNVNEQMNDKKCFQKVNFIQYIEHNLNHCKLIYAAMNQITLLNRPKTLSTILIFLQIAREGTFCLFENCIPVVKDTAPRRDRRHANPHTRTLRSTE